jgi:hypothetical protein
MKAKGLRCEGLPNPNPSQAQGVQENFYLVPRSFILVPVFQAFKSRASMSLWAKLKRKVSWAGVAY